MNESQIPWKDKKWLPGVLNKAQMISLMEAHLILDCDLGNAKIDIEEDASALDLHLSNEVYEMLKGSIKPFAQSYREILNDSEYAKRLAETDGLFSLQTGHCYLVKIKERLSSSLNMYPIYGQATAKSSVGRVDVIARLIVDGMKEYESFNPKEIRSGEMFLEITPITFNVRIKEGRSISQLRFFYGKIEDSLITDERFIQSILNLHGNATNHGTLSVDISNSPINENNKILAAAYKAKKAENADKEIELGRKVHDESERYPQKQFWDFKQSVERNSLKTIQIEKDQFYILRSKERISLPGGVCIYCRAMDETLGEMRIHYAGFVHPFFGFKRNDTRKGTPLIFEVRGHNVPVLLTHEEILARLFIYRMSEIVDEEKYDEQLKHSTNAKTNYNDQELKLSNLFQEFWSE